MEMADVKYYSTPAATPPVLPVFSEDRKDFHLGSAGRAAGREELETITDDERKVPAKFRESLSLAAKFFHLQRSIGSEFGGGFDHLVGFSIRGAMDIQIY